MALQYATLYRNEMLDGIEVLAGVSAVLKLRTGAQPANCQTADSGTVVATLALPSDWMAAAAAGAKAKAGTWEDPAADSAGTIAHWRLYENDGTTVIMQGSAGKVGTEDLVLDNDVVEAGQQITITTFTLTAPGA